MAKVPNMGIPPIGGFIAGESLDSYQYRFVELQGDQANKVWIANGGSTTYAPFGVLQNAPSTNEEAAVQVYGTTKLVVAHGGGAASPGSYLTCDGSGRGYLTTTGSLAVAVALELSDASASSIIAVLLLPGKSDLSMKST